MVILTLLLQFIRTSTVRVVTQHTEQYKKNKKSF